MSTPANPKIFHITHVNNLQQIAQLGGLWSDAERMRQSLQCELVGMSEIKRRRLEELEVSCHAGTKVGEYVPFYFCPRSIMLFILHKGNHPDINYGGGQEPIVHLQSDLKTIVQWAEKNQIRWAFSDQNAGCFLANFYNRLHDLDQINWNAVQSTDFRNRQIQDGKQAEFLIHQFCPWEFVEKVGVLNTQVAEHVEKAISMARQKPIVRIETGWYY
jgi:hypothetical protein